MEELMFFECKMCGNTVEMIVDSGMPMECCGEQMTEIISHTHEMGSEKHLPEVKMGKNYVEVEVGTIPHPMSDSHYIEWIILQTNNGVYRHNLIPGEQAKATFYLSAADKPIAVYSYCNIHGLWKTSLSEKPVSRIVHVEDDEVCSNC